MVTVGGKATDIPGTPHKCSEEPEVAQLVTGEEGGSTEVPQ